MQDDKAIASLFNLLNEARETRRQAQSRLEQNEQENRQLRIQVEEADAVIQRARAALQAIVGDLLSDSTSPARTSSEKNESERVDLSPRRERRPHIAKPMIRHDIEVKSTRFAELKIPQAAMILLRESGGPLHVNELYNRMLENGFQFGGDNHLISLSVSLNRNPRFRKVGPGTFDLVIRDAGQVAS